MFGFSGERLDHVFYLVSDVVAPAVHRCMRAVVKGVSDAGKNLVEAADVGFDGDFLLGSGGDVQDDSVVYRYARRRMTHFTYQL